VLKSYLCAFTIDIASAQRGRLNIRSKFPSLAKIVKDQINVPN
jgi:hypothetical protein